MLFCFWAGDSIIHSSLIIVAIASCTLGFGVLSLLGFVHRIVCLCAYSVVTWSLCCFCCLLWWGWLCFVLCLLNLWVGQFLCGSLWLTCGGLIVFTYWFLCFGAWSLLAFVVKLGLFSCF